MSTAGRTVLFSVVEPLIVAHACEKEGPKPFSESVRVEGTKATTAPSRHKRTEELTDTGNMHRATQGQVTWGLSVAGKRRREPLFLTQKPFPSVNSSQREN